MNESQSDRLTPKQREALGLLAMGMLRFETTEMPQFGIGSWRLKVLHGEVDVTSRLIKLRAKGMVCVTYAKVVLTHKAPLKYELTKKGLDTLWPQGN